MQTEEQINGGAVVMIDNAYPFDAGEIEIQVPVGKGLILTHVFSKPQPQDHLDREKATRRTTTIARDGEATPDADTHEANGTFYDNLIRSAHAHKIGSVEHVKEYSDEECKRLSFEAKDKAVAQMYSSDFSIEDESNDPLAHLFERDGTMVVLQEFEDSYAIRYTMKVPTKVQRMDYLSGVQVRQKFEKKNRQTLKTSFNLNKGVKLFDALMVKIEGGRIQAGEYSEERRSDFLQQVDVMFKNGCVDALVGYFNKASD